MGWKDFAGYRAYLHWISMIAGCCFVRLDEYGLVSRVALMLHTGLLNAMNSL